MRPARQGAFDGLCGVYAIINALELVGVTGRRSAIHEELFMELIHSLGAAALLSAMHDGLESWQLVRAAEIGFAQLEHDHGLRLAISQPFDPSEFGAPEDFYEALRKRVASPRTAVILHVSRAGRDHWTVARSFQGCRLLLRDSAGTPSLDLRRLEVGARRYRVDPSQTLIIKRVGARRAR